MVEISDWMNEKFQGNLWGKSIKARREGVKNNKKI